MTDQPGMIFSSFGMQPVELRCEYLKNPSGIDEPAPRLSWQLRAEGRGRRQTAYHILVARSPEMFIQDKGDLWDSGKVISNQTVQVVYAGTPLVSRQRCWWTVRVWDEDNQVGTSSEVAFWEMGLLHAEDWSARWIGLEKRPPAPEHSAFAVYPSPLLRTTFTLTRVPQRARLYATALGVYEARLNGQRIGDTLFAPGWTDYRQRLDYQAYDVTSLLMLGENVLGAIIGDGWYSGYIGYEHKRAFYGEDPAFLAQLSIEYQQGEVQIIRTDSSWRALYGPLRYSELLHGEWYDARDERPGWDGPGYDDRSWLPVNTIPVPTPPRLVAERAQPVRMLSTLPPQNITTLAAGHSIIDFGQNLVGWVQMKVQGEAGTKVQLRFAEMLDAQGRLYRESLRSAEQTDTYIVRGQGVETFTPHFTFHGFRYVEITGYPGAFSPAAMTACVIGSDTPSVGTFTCSHTLVNQLHQNVIWSQRANFLSVPTDCPQRDERLGWLGDAQIFVRAATYNGDMAAFFTRWLEDIADAQFPSGAFSDVAPRVVVEAEGAPAWGDAGIIIPWTLYQVYGDRRLLERHWGAMTRWLNYISEANPDGIWRQRRNNDYGDWLAVDAVTSKELLASAFYANSAHLMMFIAQVLEREEEGLYYQHLWEHTRSAFQDAYVRDDGRIVGEQGEETQTAYVLALQMDLLPVQLRDRAAHHLVEDIQRHNGHLSTGFLGVRYLLPALTEAGYSEVAYQLLLNDTYPSWGYSIAQGATTIWERWDGWTAEHGFQNPDMNSFNHYSLGSVDEWFYRYVAGIDLLAGASSTQPQFLLRPYPGGGLRSAEATYHSVRGMIKSAWEYKDDRFVFHLSVPANTSALVELPVHETASVREGQSPIESVPGISFVRNVQDRKVYHVKAGEYHFTVA